jgi:hypothetical protein
MLSAYTEVGGIASSRLQMPLIHFGCQITSSGGLGNSKLESALQPTIVAVDVDMHTYS